MFGMGSDDDDERGSPNSNISLYRRFLLNKYPEMTFKNYQRLTHNLESIKKRA